MEKMVQEAKGRYIYTGTYVRTSVGIGSSTLTLIWEDRGLKIALNAPYLYTLQARIQDL